MRTCCQIEVKMELIALIAQNGMQLELPFQEIEIRWR